MSLSLLSLPINHLVAEDAECGLERDLDDNLAGEVLYCLASRDALFSTLMAPPCADDISSS